MSKTPKKKPGDLFAPDEMNLAHIPKNCTPEHLLTQQNVYFLKDVVKVLDVDSLKVKRRARELMERGENTWDVMGVRKVWNHWIVRMTVFSGYYQTHLKPKVRSIEAGWDGNTLMQQEGTFLLSDVCRLIPFSTHQLRYQAKRNPNAKEEYGIWKDEELNAFVVEMAQFAPWIYRLWEGKHRQA